MSDQDFFFDDDEPKPAKSAKSTKSAKAAPVKAPGSGSKPSQTPSKSAAATSASKDAAVVAPAGAFMEQSLSMPVVSLLVVIGLLVGVIVGFLIGGGVQSQSPAVTGTGAIGNTGTGTSGTGAGTATPGQLTPDQIQQGLPAGHPSVGATTTPAP